MQLLKWRVNEDLPQPSIIRYVGGFNDEIELVKSSKDE
jgi:hypothetical protein